MVYTPPTTEPYGFELLMDLAGCNKKLFTKKMLSSYCKHLCGRTDMVPVKLVFWDQIWRLRIDRWISKLTHMLGITKADWKPGFASYEDHLNGITCVQFIETSNITIHTLSNTGTVLINFFTCKDFDRDIVLDFTREWWGGAGMEYTFELRGVRWKS